MASRECQVEECGRRCHARGYCDGHYLQFRRTGTTGPLRRRNGGPIQPCDFPECGRPIKARGLCQFHYDQRKAGKPLSEKFAPKSCGWCNQEFTPTDVRRNYCSGPCKSAGQAARRAAGYRERYDNDPIFRAAERARYLAIPKTRTRLYNARYTAKIEGTDKHETAKERARRHARTLRQLAVDTLGGQCVVCGIEDVRCLEIDHIDGGGSEERARLSKNAIHKRIIDGAPGYQLLCANHHSIKTYENGDHLKTRLRGAEAAEPAPARPGLLPIRKNLAWVRSGVFEHLQVA